jgi:hypothetical protein
LVDFYTPLLNHPEYFPSGVHASAGSPPADTMTNVLYRALTAPTMASAKVSARPMSLTSVRASAVVSQSAVQIRATNGRVYDIRGLTVRR